MRITRKLIRTSVLAACLAGLTLATAATSNAQTTHQPPPAAQADRRPRARRLG